MKKNRLIIGIALLAISCVIVIWKGFNVGLQYSENTSIMIGLEKEFQVSDIRNITNEVFPNQKVMIQPVEAYKTTVKITTTTVSEEQLEDLKNKINEKYELEKEVSDFAVTNQTNTRIRDLVRPYILPMFVSAIIILAFELLKFRKKGLMQVLKCSMIPVIVAQLLLGCVYAITRAPINQATMIISMAIYIVSEYLTMLQLKKMKVEN